VEWIHLAEGGGILNTRSVLIKDLLDTDVFATLSRWPRCLKRRSTAAR
jgi:hypothetical protein